MSTNPRFERLMREIRSCQACAPHLPLGPRPVLRAAPDARLLIVGQAPGIRVHETGIPWNDPSGNRLRAWLGLSPKEFYDEHLVAIIPIGFCYPGSGPRGDRPPRRECRALWADRLHAALPAIELTLLIGQYAQAYYLGARRPRSLTDTVRHWRTFLPDYLPLPHPSGRNNIWLKANPWFEAEVLGPLRGRIKRLVEGSRLLDDSGAQAHLPVVEHD